MGFHHGLPPWAYMMASISPSLPKSSECGSHVFGYDVGTEGWTYSLPVVALRNDQTGTVLLIDAANVVGSRPTGWWRDRAGAARAFVDQIRGAVEADRLPVPVVVVLEGKARDGVQAGVVGDVTVLHAPGSGDDKLIDVTTDASDQVTLVTADRGLRQRAEALGANVVGPGWLLELLKVE